MAKQHNYYECSPEDAAGMSLDILTQRLHDESTRLHAAARSVSVIAKEMASRLEQVNDDQSPVTVGVLKRLLAQGVAADKHEPNEDVEAQLEEILSAPEPEPEPEPELGSKYANDKLSALIKSKLRFVSRDFVSYRKMQVKVPVKKAGQKGNLMFVSMGDPTFLHNLRELTGEYRTTEQWFATENASIRRAFKDYGVDMESLNLKPVSIGQHLAGIERYGHLPSSHAHNSRVFDRAVLNQWIYNKAHNITSKQWSGILGSRF